VLLLLTTPVALMAHVPVLLGGGLVRFLSRTASGDAGPRRAAARAGRFHQRGRHLDGGAVRRRLEPARATAAARTGGLLGLLIYRPQLGLLIPAALLAGRHWRASEGVAVSLGERDVAHWHV
jgi:hypothetical protein